MRRGETKTLQSHHNQPHFITFYILSYSCICISNKLTTKQYKQKKMSENSKPAVSTENNSGSANTQISDELLQREVPCLTMDGDKVPVKVALLMQSETFKNMWQDLNMSDGKMLDEFVFPITTVPTKAFKQVVEWLQEHLGKPVPVPDDDPNTKERKWFTLSEYEENFFKVDVEELAQFIVAGNFLHIPSLYLFGCQAMAKLMMDKTPEEIAELFGLEDDMTEEEKAAIRRKNVWCKY